MVFTVYPVATIVIRKIGKRRESIGEMKLLYRCNYKVIWVGEDELFVLFAINKYTSLSWRT